MSESTAAVNNKIASGNKTTPCFTHVKKRNSRVIPFSKKRIEDAIFKAAKAVGGEDRLLAEELSNVVSLYLKKNFIDKNPSIEEIQDIVEKVLIETGHAKTAKAYILYREKRTDLRSKLQVRKRVQERTDSTDLSLLVTPLAKDKILTWEKQRIAQALQKEAKITEDLSWDIASSVEQKIFRSGIGQISTSLIRELVDNELFERGLGKKLKKQAVIGMPSFDIEQLIYSKSSENSNITSNNPEAINLAIAETTLKQYMLQNIFSADVATGHLKGMVHVHDLGYPRVYCSSHSLEYIKKYGLDLGNLDTASAPASHARTLTGHLNTYLASMQAYYAGALGIGYVNIFYAPYVEGMSFKEMRQEAQYLIFSGSQNAFSRGGQSLFIDFNIHTGIPTYLKNIPAIGPGGKPTGRTYGDYEEAAQEFTRAMLSVWREGDRDGHPFAFPKCDFHITEEGLADPKQLELLDYASQIASENGSTYFIFDRDEVTLSACCRLRTQIKDNYMIEHPESMRFCGFQNVTVNLPQAAYRAGRGNIQGVFGEIDTAMDLVFKAHLQKKEFIAKLMSKPGMPMWEVGKIAKDGRPYIDLDQATYIVGLIGLNECVQALTGKELHDDDETYKLGLKIISHMFLRAKEEEKKLGLKFSLEESPAESAARRLAKVDLKNYPAAHTVVKGNVENDEAYYTNSIHFRADADIDLITRIQKQSRFHTMIESGAIIHAFIGENKPSKEAIMKLVERTYKNTQAAQLVISPEFTICNDCSKVSRGLVENCGHCESSNVYGITRIVGYYSRIDNWNKSKIGELKDRQKGAYGLT
ncbi:MAG: anaerobic ribonucleoside-triphosphate reductase [Candidatus Kappaea frigidicola]|nr:anaerobic ribonucleoside-triphosphate reductase [Candidatus Kappaea frigidicola]